ncbi:hypothetical protein BH10PSE19_BH10PSE19_08910 [soil metagenome]
MLPKQISSARPIIWTIAGSDSGGGAGIQTDLHTFHALGAYGCSVITALTAQNSVAVQAIEYTSVAMLTAQINALEADLPAKAIKLGMLGTATIMQTIIPLLQRFSGPVVCDPVMVASSGASLFAADAKAFFVENILSQAYLLTPNIPEAEALTGIKIDNTTMMREAADKLLILGAKKVLLKGGHGKNAYCQDFFTDGTQSFYVVSPRNPQPHTHGSGCTIAAAITACLSLEYTLQDAIVIAKAYVNQGIRRAQAYGKGPGPLAHGAWPSEQQDLPWVEVV